MNGALGYLAFRTRDLAAWMTLGRDVIGAHVVQHDGALALRLDQRAYRLLFEAADDSALACIGLELDDTEADALRERLAFAGVAIEAGTGGDRQRRGTGRLWWFADPDGNRIDVVDRVPDAPDAFAGGRPMGGFRADAGGFGHIALGAARFDAMRDFYQRVVGLGLSDFMEAPFRAAFFHLNARHHAIALIAADAPSVYHVMIEYRSLDDLGRAHDLALAQPDAIVTTLGRHTNDHVLSFYLRTPDAMTIELGWAGRSIDPATWVAEELTGPSLWGHDRLWLTPEKRAEARALQRTIAGVRVPDPGSRA